ncbi:MAG: hypothetical protein SCM11_03370 [Bacillota bacterium]|nr:hypothetical protein [Bacillota bacterium]
MSKYRYYENTTLSNRILDRSIVIGDTVKFRAGASQSSCVDPLRGILYTIYLTSRAFFGEPIDTVALNIMPILQPHLSRDVIIVEHDMEMDGVIYKRNLISQVLFTSHKKVRTLFMARHSDDREYDPTCAIYYRDYDPETNSLSGIQPVLCHTDSGLLPLTVELYASYMRERGFEDYWLDGEKEEMLIMPIYRHHDFWYSCLTSRHSYPVFWKSVDDCATVEFTGIIPNKSKYECMHTIAKDTLYCLLRGGEGSNYYLSHDFGRTFVPGDKMVPLWETRSKLLTYRDKVLMAYSVYDLKPNLVRNGRNNIVFVWGEGGDESQYDQLLFLLHPLGMVHYEIINYKDTLYLIFSTAELFLDIDSDPNAASRHGPLKNAKDMMRFTRIGMFDENGKLLF